MGPRCRIPATPLVVLLSLSLYGRVWAGEDGAPVAANTAWAISVGRASAVERTAPAVVAVRALGNAREEQGSGIIVDADGLVLTAFHVIKGARTLLVRTESGAEYRARVRGIDPDSDLALIEMVSGGRRFPVVRFGTSATARVAESVVVLACPFGLAHSATSGILSAKGRRNIVADNVVPLLQTDAAINPGSSGGALINLRGEVIGMINAILSTNGLDQGIGFAVPADEIVRALPALREGKPVVRPWLGVRVKTAGGVEAGVEVLTVIPGGPSAKSGLRTGDRILRFGGKRIESVAEIRALLRVLRVGERIEVEFVRKDRTAHSTLLVGKKAKNPTKD